MARDKVELLVEIIGKDGITKLLDTAATEALKLERNLKKGSKRGNDLKKAIDNVGSSWAMVVTGLNQGLELFGKLASGAQAVGAIVKETVKTRQTEARFTEKLNASVEKMAQASGFQLSDIELKTFALQADRAGIAMQDFNKLLNLSLRASAASGLEFGQVFEGLFQDTIIGASDSFLEQIGIVADLGTITEKYALDQGIAKDAIDKTKQSQAILNHLLTEVNQKFKDVDVDPFLKELGKAQQEVENLKRELGVALTFAVNDLVKKVNDRDGIKSMSQIFFESGKAIDRITDRFAKANREIDGAAFLEIEIQMFNMGKAAKSSEDLMVLLFDRIQEQAKQMVAVSGIFLNARQKADLYDTTIKNLATQYGVLETAESKYTTGAKETAKKLRDIKEVAIGTKEAIETLKETMRGETFGSDFIKEFDEELGTPGPVEEVGVGEDLRYINEKGEEFESLKALREQEKKEKKRQQKRKQEARRRFLQRKRERERQRKEAERQLKEDIKTVKEGLKKRLEAERELMAFENEAMTFFKTEAFRDPFFADLGPMEQELIRLKGITEEEFMGLSTLQVQMEMLNFSFDAASQGMSTTASALQLMGEAAGASSDRMARLAHTGQALEALTPRLQLATKTIFDMAKATDMSAGQMAAGVGTVTAAALEGAAGFITGEKEKAAVSSAVEVARAGAAFAMFATTLSPNYAVAGSMHLVNAGLFAAIAGGAGAPGASSVGAGGAGGGAAAASGMRRIPTFGQPVQSQNVQPTQVVVNMSGAIVAGANRRKTANDLGDLVQESMAGRR